MSNHRSQRIKFVDMNSKTLIVLVLILVIGFLNACNNSDQESKEEILDVKEVISTNFPNKRSELALHMRSLFNDVKAEKILLVKGDHSSIDWILEYGNLHSATPTDSSNTGELFDAFGTSFLNQLKKYQNTTEDDRISNYNQIIISCLSCHQTYCPGPMVVIKKLPIKIKE